MAVQIDKVIQKIIKVDEMEKLNVGMNDFWADYYCITDNNLDDLLTPEELAALSEGNADYIAFRLAD